MLDTNVDNIQTRDRKTKVTAPIDKLGRQNRSIKICFLLRNAVKCNQTKKATISLKML